MMLYILWLNKIKFTAIANDEAVKIVWVTATDKVEAMEGEQAQIESKCDNAHDE